ncbi:MAG: Ig-like domain-containing protein [Bacteroidetes bacterium]|nr:Ig-like domain-containing protein [Bacteroidota bacterium]
MTASRTIHLVALAAVVIIGISGCARDTETLEPAAFPTHAEVFIDGFGPNIDYQAFGGSKVDALDITTSDVYRGIRALSVTVPDAGDPAGSFAGGAFVAGSPRDLSGYDALTFRAKASMPATLNEIGFGNDNTGTSRYVAMLEDVPISTTWKKYVLPLPLPAKLNAERGLFFYAEGPENGYGYEILIDDIQYENLGTIAHPSPSISTLTVSGEPGDNFTVEGTAVTFDISGVEQTILASPGYFTFSSSDPSVATVDENGRIEAVATGTTVITARLGDLDAKGSVTVTVGAAQAGPGTPAPVPSHPAANVIALFSNAYVSVPVDTWSADWDMADVKDVTVAGDDVKKYSNLVFAGIEFISQTIDASDLTHFHMDIWTPDPTAAPAILKIKLVDFGANGVYDGGDDSEHELSFTATSSPALVTGSWISFDIPFSRFAGLRNRGHLAQLIISGNLNTVYVDNVYFRK